MQAVKSRVTRALPVGTYVTTCDNSGAKIVKIFTVYNLHTKKGRRQSAGVGDMVMATVKSGRPDMRKQVVYAVVVRQKKEYRRPDGTRIKFEDNSVVVCKDEKGNPKGTTFKGPIAKEVAERWPAIGKLASMLV